MLPGLSVATPAAAGTGSSCSQPCQGQGPALLPLVCSVLSPGCNAARSQQREPWARSAALAEPFQAGLFLQGSSSRCQPGAGLINVALINLHSRKELWAPPGRSGKDLSWERSFHCCCSGKTEFPGTGIATGEGRGMSRVCCSPSAPVFFLMNVLAAEETSQPFPGTLCRVLVAAPGGSGCGEGEGAGLVLKGFLQLLPFLATAERPSLIQQEKFTADWPQFPLLILPQQLCGSPWEEGPGGAVTSVLCCDNKLAPVAPAAPLPASCLHGECFG